MKRHLTIKDFEAKLRGKATSDRKGMFCCPAHDDKNPSLSVEFAEDGKLLAHCFAGCSQEEVINTLKNLDLWQQSNGTSLSKTKAKQSKAGRSYSAPLGDPEKTYDYLGLNGKLLFQVCRYRSIDGSKTFRQRRPDGKGNWIWNVNGTELVPYRLPELVQADEVYIVEGEKDADRLFSLGLTATCNAQGAGKWKASYAEHFKDKRACIIPDNDKTGREHAFDVARSLKGVAAEVKILEMPSLPEKGDVSDWLDAGGTKDELLGLVDKCPIWMPEPGSEEVSHPALKLDEWQVSKTFQGEPQPRKYLVDGIFPMGQASLVGGGGGVGKSFQLLALAVAVTGGPRAAS